MSVHDNRVIIINYTVRPSQGIWHSQDDYEHKGYGEPQKARAVYVAPNHEVALAHWRYWEQFSTSKENPYVFVSIEDLGAPTLLLEF